MPRNLSDARLVPAAVVTWGVAAWAVGADSRVVVAVAVVAALGCGATACAVRPSARGEASRSRAVAAGLVLAAVALVGASVAWRQADVQASPLVALADERQEVVLGVQVAVDAHAYEGPTGPASVVGLLVTHVQTRDGRAWVVRDRVTAFVDGEQRDLTVGRRLVVEGTLAPSDESRESAVVSVEERSEVTGSSWWWAGSERVRAGVRASVEHTPTSTAALVPALVTGDDAALAEQLQHEFRRTGLTHLLAVSGTNLTIVLALLLAVTVALRAPPRVVLVVGLLGVAGFVLLARPEPSVLRAAGMGVVGLAAAGYGSRGGLRVLCVAVVMLLFLDPWLSRAAGFVLSVSATAGILMLAPPFVERLGRWLPRPVALAIAVPLAAQAACTPTIAFLSGEVSVVAVLANVLVAPAVAPATVLGLVAGLVHVAAPPVAAALGWGAAACAGWIVAVAHRLSGLSGASVAWDHPWWLLLVVVPVSCWALWRISARPVVVVGVCVGLLVAAFRPPQPGWPPAGWVMVACDVGQGDATVLNSGPGEAVVVDTGIDAALVDGCLRDLGVRRVRVLVLTHADADHVGGRGGVVAGRDVERVVVGRPGVGVPGVPSVRVGRGDRFAVGDVVADVLWPVPTRDAEPPPDSERNGASVVLRARVRGVQIVLTGDVGESEQDRLVRSGVVLAADVLKVSHHGSADTSARFVEAVDPAVATISVGADNDYGHPAPEALAMLAHVGAAVHRTDLEGDVAVVVRDGRVGVVSRR